MYDILSPNMRHHPSETLESFLLVQQSIFFTTDMFIVSASRFFSKERLLFRDGGSRLAIFFEVDFKASSPYYKSGLCSQVWLLYIYLLWMCTTQTNLGEAKDTKVAIHLSLSYTRYTICNLGTFYKDEGRLAGSGSRSQTHRIGSPSIISIAWSLLRGPLIAWHIARITYNWQLTKHGIILPCIYLTWSCSESKQRLIDIYERIKRNYLLAVQLSLFFFLLHYYHWLCPLFVNHIWMRMRNND